MNEECHKEYDIIELNMSQTAVASSYCTILFWYSLKPQKLVSDKIKNTIVV